MEEHKKNTFRKACSFLKDIWFPVLILGLVVFACLFGELIATHSPTQGQLSEYLIPPAWCEGGSMEHLLGTDGLGRDIFSRLVTGARTTMMVGIAVVLVAGSIGTLVGVLAGYMGGAVDSLLMRLTDAVLSIPYTLIAMCLSVILGQSSGTVVFVLGITCGLSGCVSLRHSDPSEHNLGAHWLFYLLLLLGIYDRTLNAISSLDIGYLIPLGVGLILGVIATTKVLEYAMKKYPQPTYLIILGFVVGSVAEVYPGLPDGIEWVICIVTLLAGFGIIRYICSLGFAD